MIRVLMLDLGDTLVRGETPLPHVTGALAALSQFETAGGEPLRLCLVSDFTMPEPPPTPEKVDALFHDYLAILDRTGLRPFFEPVGQHVTLSTHAGVFKPDRKVFETALARLGVSATLAECLFVTENVGHVAAARGLGMAALTFGRLGGPDAFDDWSSGPMLIARAVAPGSHKDVELALKASLAASHRMELVSAAPGAAKGGPIDARVKVWHALDDPALGALDGVHVALPADARVRLDDAGAVGSVVPGRPSDEDVAEATRYVRGLAQNGKVAADPESRPFGATHEVTTDSEGRRYLTRKRFSAL